MKYEKYEYEYSIDDFRKILERIKDIGDKEYVKNRYKLKGDIYSLKKNLSKSEINKLEEILFLNPPPIFTIIKKEYTSEEFREILESIWDQKDKEYIKNRYKLKGDIYSLKKNLSESEFNKLEEILFLNPSLHTLNNFAQFCDVEYIAYYVSEKRLKTNRLGDRNDDHYKAEYILHINRYLHKNDPKKVFDLKDEFKRNELIWLAFNIFDTAYFLKFDNPHMSDLECFSRAERQFCKEKELDYIAYFEYEKRKNNNSLGDDKTDYEKALWIYREKRIKPLAYNIFCNRTSKGLHGNSEDDYYQAADHFDKEEFKKAIATICRDMAQNRDKRQEEYWDIACQIFNEFINSSNDYKNTDPYKNLTLIKMLKKKLYSIIETH